jgi:starch-binding outer membrane protein, SusD/RagB family
MMKQNKIVALLLLIILAAGTSCRKDLLYPQPQTSVADVSAFSTPARVLNQVLSLYGALKNGNLYGGRYQIYGEIKADNFINQLSNVVTGYDVWEENPTNSSQAIVNLWQFAYLSINNANLFIDGMDSIGASVVGAATTANYVAEAKLVRALSYYALLQYFAQPYTNGSGSNPGVPLRLNGIKLAGQSSLARSSVADVYAQILSDLNFAQANLPSAYSSAYNNTTRAHVNTAIALKTRVFLSMGLYDSVIANANLIVSANAPFTSSTGVTFSLQSDITKVFVSPYTTSESILSMPMTTTTGDNPGTQNQLAYYFSPSSKSGGVGNGEYALNANGVIADPLWKSTDRRRAFILTGGGKQWLTKYSAPSPYTDYAPIIRYSEVLLNLAEARAQVTNSVDAQAVALLSAVRSRSDATTIYTPASFANTSAFISAVLEERNIEFLGEGIRNNDLMRLQLAIPTKGTPGVTIVSPGVSPGGPPYIWPISANELALNPLCTDN